MREFQPRSTGYELLTDEMIEERETISFTPKIVPARDLLTIYFFQRAIASTYPCVK